MKGTITLGQWVLDCFRAAGDPEGRFLKMETVLVHLEHAVVHALARAPLRVTRVIEVDNEMAGLQSIPCEDLAPLEVRHESSLLRRISRVQGRILETHGWFEESYRVHFTSTISETDSIDLMGRLRSISYDLGHRNHVLATHPDPDADPPEIQWVTPDMDEVVRYRVIATCCEDLGEIEKAMYFGRKAVEAEIASMQSLQPSALPPGMAGVSQQDGFND